jgi:hypothetical protein
MRSLNSTFLHNSAFLFEGITILFNLFCCLRSSLTAAVTCIYFFNIVTWIQCCQLFNPQISLFYFPLVLSGYVFGVHLSLAFIHDYANLSKLTYFIIFILTQHLRELSFHRFYNKLLFFIILTVPLHAYNRIRYLL